MGSDDSDAYEYLLLTSWEPLRVEISELQSCEQELNRSCGVAVRRSIRDWQLHLGQPLLHLRTCVPGGVVQEDRRVLLPARALLVELVGQVPEESRHYIRVSDGLGQSTPEAAVCVKSCDQRDPWRYLLV